ncbi:MAG: hypothetical protein KJ620_03560 [Candidatus Edwardsbacteria bacterium]|nr:hypothetical protein [Candidatus Edwardsbacteria bacterium]MBU1576178.1 hypothetical protein [Candidatus Edwardsbacteria bacterium]MBU2594233.1 hypothetical protein [Candidatus Edwardsbacteria bacterium]
MKRIIIILIFITNYSNLFSQNQEIKRDDILYIGALETKRSTWPDNTYDAIQDTNVKKIVRPLFYKNDNQWISLEKKIADYSIYPSGREWYVAFDSKNIGFFYSKREQIKCKDAIWTYPRDSYHSTIGKTLPTIGSCNFDFSSWANEKEYRPLIVVSHPNCNDPEKWKPFNPELSDLEKIFPIYKSYIAKTFPSLQNIEIKQLKYLKSYQSNTLNQLIQIGIITNNNGMISYPVWIYKSNSGELINISKIIDYNFSQDEFTDDDNSINTLIDAGDYDNNGKSEIIFWSSRYNGDGYVMFFDDLTKMIDFTWSYH